MIHQKRFSLKPLLLTHIALVLAVCFAVPMAGWIHQQQQQRVCRSNFPHICVALAKLSATEGDFVQAVKYQQSAVTSRANACNNRSAVQKLQYQLAIYEKLAHAAQETTGK